MSIKLENTQVYGWEAAIRGMRNPLNSWDKSDSSFDDGLLIGENDHKLMTNLCKGGSEESKWRRFITVTCDITAPLYWIAEHDTYKVGTVRNSCSFMHKGLSQPFTINDFSIQNANVYKVLNPIEKAFYPLVYKDDKNDDFRRYTLPNGREYKIYKSGRIIACPFSYVDNYGKGRLREFKEKEITPSPKPDGYYEINIGGRTGEKWLLHRLIAQVWIPNPNGYETVIHIDGNKGNNSVDNLEWCTLSDNIKLGFQNGLFDKNTIHGSYLKWKNKQKVAPEIRFNIKTDYANGIKSKELAEKYNLSEKYINSILFLKHSEYEEDFMEAYLWETLIDELNKIRAVCIETSDNNYFQALRQLLPSGFNQHYTWQANYEVLANIYRQRKNHRLDEWHSFCKWIESLPYSEFIIGKEE